MKSIVINNEVQNYYIQKDGTVINKTTNRILKGNINNAGYKMIQLVLKNGKRQQIGCHRLVATAYLENPFNYPVVNHKDGNRLNNNLDNLEWTTYQKNSQHSYLSDRKRASGKRNKNMTIFEDNIQWKRYKDTNYLVSKDGQLYNIKTNILLLITLADDGYIRNNLRINNKTKSLLRHNLVFEVWGNKPKTKNMLINHIDGNKQNNKIENLELCSKSENVKHSCYVLKQGVKKIASLDINGNIITVYPSMTVAAQENKVTVGALTYAYKNHSKCKNKFWKLI